MVNALQKIFFKKRRLGRSEKKQLDLLEFLARLIILSIPLYLIIGLGVNLEPMQISAASQSASVLEGLGFEVEMNDFILSSTYQGAGQPFIFMINEDCTGWKSMLFLFALIFSVPGIALKKRLFGLVIGIPLIWIGNIARIVGVVLAQESYGVQTALIIHDYLWQLGLIAIVIIIWVVWLSWARKQKKGILNRIKRFFGDKNG